MAKTPKTKDKLRQYLAETEIKTKKDVAAYREVAKEYAKVLKQEDVKAVFNAEPPEIKHPKEVNPVSEQVNRIERLDGLDKTNYERQDNKFIDQSIDDKVNALESKSNSPTTPGKMVEIAKNRGWGEIKVSGGEVFKAQVWQGIKVEGYMPTQSEQKKVAYEVLSKEFIKSPKEAAQRFPALKGAENVVKAIAQKNIEDGLNPEQREIVDKRVKELVAGAIEKGHIPKEKTRKKENSQELTL